MSKESRGVRDGTGPYKDSFRVRVEGKSTGRRIEAGEECPVKEESSKEESNKEPSFW